MIPRVFYRIWLDEPVPERYGAFWSSFQRQNRGWDLVTIKSSDAVREWMRPEMTSIFDACLTHAGRSDVVRYEAMYRFGGVYVDADVECLRGFDELVLESTPFAGWEDERLVCPTVLGSPPGHAFFRQLPSALEQWFWERPSAPPNQSTGPHFLTAYARGRTDVRLFPPETFYPVHWSRKRELGGPYPESSFAVHYWDARWLPNGPPQR